MRPHPTWMIGAGVLSLAVITAVVVWPRGVYRSFGTERGEQVIAPLIGQPASDRNDKASHLRPADDGELEHAASLKTVDEPPLLSEEVGAEQFLSEAVAVTERFRPDEWDVRELAASLGDDPAAAFEFVRDAIGFDPYPGVLRGAEGALSARSGNAWDRALLLKALLEHKGRSARLAHATLDATVAATLIDRARRRPERAWPSVPFRAELVAAIDVRSRRDDAALRLALGGRVQALGVDETGPALTEVASHAWVQVLQDGTWRDLDPTLPDAKVGTSLATSSGTSSDVPASQQHSVIIRVLAESLTDGKVTGAVALEQKLTAAAGADQFLLLAFMPEAAANRGLLRGGASATGSVVPTLWVDGEQTAGTPIVPTVPEDASGGLDVFGGGEASGSQLVGLYLEVETRVPGQPPNLARHVLLDQVPPTARTSPLIRPEDLRHTGPASDVGRSLAGFHHFMISTGGASRYAMAELRRRAAEVAARADELEARAVPLHLRTWPLWAMDLMLVEASERLIVPALDTEVSGRVYIAQPRVYLSSWLPEPSSVTGLTRETDLLIDSVRVLLPDRHDRLALAKGQLHYGSLQSALETESALRIATAWDATDRSVFSTSVAMSDDLRVVAPADMAQLPTGTPEAIRRALRRGALVVVPGELSAAVAWWTIAPSGFASAIVDPGAGMSKIGPKGPPKPPGPKGPSGPKPGSGAKAPPKSPPKRANPVVPSRPARNPGTAAGRWRFRHWDLDAFEHGGKPRPGNEYQLAVGVSQSVTPSVSGFTTVLRGIMKVIAHCLAICLHDEAAERAM